MSMFDSKEWCGGGREMGVGELVDLGVWQVYGRYILFSLLLEYTCGYSFGWESKKCRLTGLMAFPVSKNCHDV